MNSVRFSTKNSLSIQHSTLTDTAGFIHRYPVLQCKQIRNDLIVTGISQGADCLCQLTQGPDDTGHR